MLHNEMRRYYRFAMSGQRSLFARAVDFLVLRAIILLGFLVWFYLQTAQPVLSLFLAVIAATMVSVAIALYNSIRLDQFVEREKLRLSRHYLFEQMVLMPAKEFTELIAALARGAGYTVEKCEPYRLFCRKDGADCLLFGLQNHPDQPVSPQQALECYRLARAHNVPKAVLVSTAPVPVQTKTLLQKCADVEFRIWNHERLLDLAQKQSRLPDQKVVEAALMEELYEKRMTMAKLKKRAVDSTRTRGYLVCGGVLAFAALLTGKTLYYPLMAGLCFFLAFLSRFTGPAAPVQDRA
ncbi:MAG: hypothetical protein IJP30_05330 [Clostridia bacterium]|nr:hypothetical protein [Clostridia bacterium]